MTYLPNNLYPQSGISKELEGAGIAIDTFLQTENPKMSCFYLKPYF